MKVTPLFALIALAATSALGAQPIAPAQVAIENGAYAQSLTGVPGDPAAGRAAASNRAKGNCMTCHPITDMSDLPFHGDLAPTLDGVAGRYSEAQLRAIVINAKDVFGPQTFMPAMYRTDGLNIVAEKFKGQPILAAQEVEDVVAYLLTLKDD